jgi:hypothetical protein
MAKETAIAANCSMTLVDCIGFIPFDSFEPSEKTGDIAIVNILYSDH